ncbi:diguanylate cyclase [Thalassotalea sp. 1_MG-2023]|uniref:GGDEF domain-containing response regulator n=1 Tax=Thalassotalea sp. 1_MG-2023 TaxID=3062680 RepID=UPI0026E37186|nr:diguanylate cyclase [Thalassotalea sp. 1_MG-2023]MDO6427695.1 diguanylate cyclase [Thalassotalea sp. 1_MG-2023]
MLHTSSLLKAADTTPLGEHLNDLQQTILVVGVNQSFRHLSVTFGKTYHVINVDYQQEIDESVRKKGIDLIILHADDDKELWIKSLRNIRSSPFLSFIPIIIISNKNSVNEQLTALEFGALDCMVQPFNPFILTAKVSNYMKLMENVRKLELASSIDGLTGLANRMALDSTLFTEWHRMKRSKQPLSALMIDVDHFKLFNDKYGHLEGDRCLKIIADALTNVTGRNSDFAARFGGEEFAVLLPGTDSFGAEKVAQLILEKIADLSLPSASESTNFLTVSIGIGSCLPSDLDVQEIKPSWLLQEADKHLYMAKNNGRNQYSM